MAQNSKFTEPRETRATAMNRADVYRELYNAVEFNLFGAGSWPADREASAAFWKLLDDLGLTTDDPDKPGTTQYTPLGLELNVELISIFAGAVNLWVAPQAEADFQSSDDDAADNHPGSGHHQIHAGKIVARVRHPRHGSRHRGDLLDSGQPAGR